MGQCRTSLVFPAKGRGLVPVNGPVQMSFQLLFHATRPLLFPGEGVPVPVPEGKTMNFQLWDAWRFAPNRFASLSVSVGALITPALQPSVVHCFHAS